MGPNAGVDLEREKEKFDKKLQLGRFAHVVKQQEYYNGIINVLEKANNHM